MVATISSRDLLEQTEQRVVGRLDSLVLSGSVFVEQQAALYCEDECGQGPRLVVAGPAVPQGALETWEPVVDRGPGGEAGEAPGLLDSERVDLGEEPQVGLELRCLHQVPERSQQVGHGAVVTGFEPVAEQGKLLGAGIVDPCRDQLVLGAEVVHQHPRARSEFAGQLAQVGGAHSHPQQIVAGSGYQLSSACFVTWPCHSCNTITETPSDGEILLSAKHDLIHTCYAAFNARDIDAALEGLHRDVDWPNAIDGVRLHGHDEVREYWKRQFQTIDPRVDPQMISEDEQGRFVVDVHQVVRDLDGGVIADQHVQHVYTVSTGLIARMDIEAD